MSVVRQSYERARRADFARHFYDHLLTSNDDIRRMFASTNFESQRSLLIHGIFSMLDYSEGKEIGKLAIGRLAGTHGPTHMNVTPAMYDQWMRTFAVTIQATDPEWTPALAQQWEDALRPAIEALKAPHHARPRR